MLKGRYYFMLFKVNLLTFNLNSSLNIMETVLITGGSGMLGTALTEHLLKKGYHVIILTRKLPKENGLPKNLSYALWNVNAETIDFNAIKKADHIIHLAGAGVVDKKWTDAYKKEILESRTESSFLLVNALKKNSNNVKTVVSASAIGWYGADSAKGKHFIETDNADNSFLGETCKEWEQSIEPVTLLGKRLVKLRIGIVLSNTGGALSEFKKPLYAGVAGILGDGKQMVSWVHIDDLCRLFIYGIENKNLAGVYNAVAPIPVSNKVLTLELAKQMKGKLFIPLHVPVFVLKLMLGTRSVEVLKSTTVSDAKILKTGFLFNYPTITLALEELCKKN